jgi:phosphate transport system permease protein
MSDAVRRSFPVGAWLLQLALPALLGLVLLVYGAVLYDLARAGLTEIDVEYLTSEPQMSGRTGGVLPMIVATLTVLAIAVVTALPISIGAALFVTEILHPASGWAQLMRACLLILACVPSIAFGFFGAAFFGQTLGFGISLLTGGLTLAVMILPVCTFALEEVFRMLPSGYRAGAFALGSSRTRFIFTVLLPLSAPQILSVALLGMSRALAETAALLFTSGYSDRMPHSVMDPGRVLSVHIYDLAMNIPGGDRMASAAALLLIALFLVIVAIFLLLSGWSHFRKGKAHA